MNNQPTHHIYNVVEKDGEKDEWNKVGAAWPHKDAKGYSLEVDERRLVMREPFASKDDADTGNA